VSATPTTTQETPEPAVSRPRRRWPRVVLGVGIGMIVLAGIAGIWLYRQVNPPGAQGPTVAVEIPSGSSLPRIAAVLDNRGVITSARLFRLYARVTGAGSFQAGQYTFHRRSDMGDVIDVLEGGPEISYVRLTVPEGYRLEQVAARVDQLAGRSAERFLELARGGQIRSALQPHGSTNLEGLVLPETYVLDEREDEQRILHRMVAAFEDTAASLDLTAKADRLGLSPYEAVIVASLIEREARVPQDRGPIARVIYNRLGRRMKLDIDASVRYGLGKHTGRLLFRDLDVETPYNTYRRPGLPPTPIAAPGRAALEAALNPPPGPWLYYVIADASGGHAFSVTLAEHNRRIAEGKAKGIL
jgi:UPF0755 protein